jgi:hypothetical protein
VAPFSHLGLIISAIRKCCNWQLSTKPNFDSVKVLVPNPREASPATTAYDILTKTLNKLNRLGRKRSEATDIRELIRDARFILLNLEAGRSGLWLDPHTDTGDEPVIGEDDTYTAKKVRDLRHEWEKRAKVRRGMNSEWIAAEARIDRKKPKKHIEFGHNISNP